jgi:hypothetical protein
MLLAACSSSGPDTTTTPPGGSTAVPSASTAGLPFSYQGSGESSSTTFHVATTGSYLASWTLTGVTGQPACSVSIALVGNDGSSQQLIPGVPVGPTDTKSDSKTVQLTAGDWRFQEGGGCGWKVSVALP